MLAGITGLCRTMVLTAGLFDKGALLTDLQA